MVFPSLGKNFPPHFNREILHLTCRSNRMAVVMFELMTHSSNRAPVRNNVTQQQHLFQFLITEHSVTSSFVLARNYQCVLSPWHSSSWIVNDNYIINGVKSVEGEWGCCSDDVDCINSSTLTLFWTHCALTVWHVFKQFRHHVTQASTSVPALVQIIPWSNINNTLTQYHSAPRQVRSDTAGVSTDSDLNQCPCPCRRHADPVDDLQQTHTMPWS